MYTKTLPQTLIIESLDEKIRTNTMRKLVKLHLCLSKVNNNACKICRSCRLYEKGNHPDLIRVEKDIDKKNIPVEIIRHKIIKKINSRPHLSKIICVTIDNAQSLSIGAQNALLKTLEEPPFYVKIILCVDKASKLLPTIVSRSQILSLQSQEIKSSENPLREIVNLDLIERFKLAKEVADKDKKEGRKDSQNTLNFIDDLTCNLREFVKTHANQPDIVKAVIKDIRKILDGRMKISYNVNKQLVLENILLQTITDELYRKNI